MHRTRRVTAFVEPSAAGGVTRRAAPGLPTVLAFVVAAALTTFGSEPSGFYHEWWFETGATNGNPTFNNRFRVNSPEVSLHPRFGSRSEARSSGCLFIFAPEDPRLVTRAELYLELWGGHPGGTNKRATINGRRTVAIPEVGTADGHCTHQYPTLALQPADLVNGHNAVQFAIDQGTTFWGHFIVEEAALRLTLTNGHAAVAQAGLADFTAHVEAAPSADREVIALRLVFQGALPDAVASVDFQGRYHGYDENGDAAWNDWHGFTKRRAPVGTLGVVTNAPFALAWDTTMLPDQSGMAVRARVRFKADTNLVYVTPSLAGLRTPDRGGVRVTVHPIRDLPPHFWSRAGRLKEAVIPLDIDPARIESAELHTVTWDGGAGTVKEYFKLNGRFFPVAGSGRHDTIYTRLPVDPQLLRRGDNKVELLSDTEHHGIEILKPGPALIIRSRR
jgi:hypothetical protein